MQSPHQHSPKRSSPLSQIHTPSCDTPLSVPSAPLSPYISPTPSAEPPLTPPDSSPRQTISVGSSPISSLRSRRSIDSHSSSVYASPSPSPSTPSLQSSTISVPAVDPSPNGPAPADASPTRDATRPLASVLSATAPQFQSRLALFDPPIHIHELAAVSESLPPAAVSLPVIGRGTQTDLSPIIPTQATVHLPSQNNAAAPHIPNIVLASNPTAFPNSSFNAQASPVISQAQPRHSQIRALNPAPPAAHIPSQTPIQVPNQAPAFVAPFSNAPAQPLAQQQQAQSAPASERPPNVYINGLPPNFPEEDLYKMTREFGEVVSVRTFTRHVCDKPSGYGFVLFETLEAAERCIETLRKYRNLHPSFSKQAHKIPGTNYSSSVPASSDTTESDTHDSPDNFKTRMEQLKDTTSTNLYMEGLPLTTDERALAALVKPYRIMSNRFFQTRLSNPPRLIAFVRLETRAAAEDIIERLHGRHVRGWQDEGSRISVRFADTSEQRELRRTERVNREGEHSPARLTIAQAALLNQKGAQLTPPSQSMPLGSANFGHAAMRANSPLLVNGLMAGQLGGSLSPLAQASAALPYQQQPLISSLDGMYDGQGRNDFSANAAQYLGQDLRLPQHLYENLLSTHDLQTQLRLSKGLAAATARAENGFTPMEMMLLKAHAEQQQLLEAEREERMRALMLSQARGLAGSMHAPSKLPNTGASSLRRDSARRLLDVLPSVSEDAFHARAGHLQQHQSLTDRGEGMDRDGLALAEQSSRLAFDLDQLSLGHQQHQRNQTLATLARAEAGANAPAVHTRSTTLPSQYLSSRSSQSLLNGSGQHSNSINSSILNNSTNSPHIANSSYNINGTNRLGNGNISFGQNHHIRSSTTSNTSPNVSHNDNDQFTSADSSTIATGLYSPRTTTSNTSHSRLSTSSGNLKSGSLTKRQPHHALDEDHDREDHSPLVSPALTYSARTPVTLSPATPYSGFFPNDEQTFVAQGTGAGAGKGWERTSALA